MAKARTACTTRAVSKLARSARCRWSRARPMRSSLSSGNWSGRRPRCSGTRRAAQAGRAYKGWRANSKLVSKTVRATEEGKAGGRPGSVGRCRSNSSGSCRRSRKWRTRGGGAHFQGLQRGLLPGGGHESLRGKAAGVEAVMGAATQAAMVQGATKKSWSGWRTTASSRSRIFLYESRVRTTKRWRCRLATLRQGPGRGSGRGQQLRPRCRVNGWKMPELITRNVGIEDDIRRLGERAEQELDAVHDFFEHSQTV